MGACIGGGVGAGNCAHSATFCGFEQLNVLVAKRSAARRRIRNLRTRAPRRTGKTARPIDNRDNPVNGVDTRWWKRCPPACGHWDGSSYALLAKQWEECVSDTSRVDPELAAFFRDVGQEFANYPPVRMEVPYEPHRRTLDTIALKAISGGPVMTETSDRWVTAR